jgi:hypothetical protein
MEESRFLFDRKSKNLLLHLGVEGSLLLGNASIALLLGKTLGAVSNVGVLLLLLLAGLGGGVLTDSLVSLGVHVLDLVGGDALLEEGSELLLVALLIFLLEVLHVLSNVDTEDVVAEELVIVGLGLNVVTRETRAGVGDVETTVGGTLQGTKDTGTSRGAGNTDVKEGLEGTGTLLVGLSLLDSAIGLGDTLVLVSKAKLGQDTAGKEQTGGVGSRPVGQTTLDAVAGKLVGVGSGQDKVTLELGVHDLADNVTVGEANHQSVLGRVVLVLGLDDQPLASVVVGLAL